MSENLDLSHLPPLREIIARHNLRAEKKLGQNFLLDQNLTDKIVRTAGPLTNVTVFEIGPGPGGLTRSLLKTNVKKVISLEYDPRAIEALSSLRNAAQNRLEIIHTDALNTNLCGLADTPRAIVANLPYNIATPLLIGWLKQLRENSKNFRSMTLMFQREVADRLVARPHSKAYGRLSILTQWLCETRIVLNLPPQAFTPPPKVTSAVVHFTPKILSPDSPDFATVEKLTAAAFGQRRKMLRSSLKDFTSYFSDCRIDPTSRAEELTVETFISLATCVSRK